MKNTRRGMTGLLLVALIASVIWVVRAHELLNEKTEQNEQLAKLARRAAVRTSITAAVEKALEGEAEGTCQEKVQLAAARLSALEEAVEKVYSNKGERIDLWFGRTTELKRCRECLDFGSVIATWNGRPAFAGVTVLFCDEFGRIYISSNGQAFAPWVYTGIGPAAIGASVQTKRDKWSFRVGGES